MNSPTDRQLSEAGTEKVATLYSLTRGDAALAKYSKDEIAEMVSSGNLKGQTACSSRTQQPTDGLELHPQPLHASQPVSNSILNPRLSR